MIIHHQADVATIAITTASISLVQLGTSLAHTSMGTLVASVTLAQVTPLTMGYYSISLPERSSVKHG